MEENILLHMLCIIPVIITEYEMFSIHDFMKVYAYQAVY